MADHPLRTATRLRLGGPLPRQLADRPQAHPSVIGPCGSPPFLAAPAGAVVSSGISTPFGMLSQSEGQMTYVLLTRAPLYSARRLFAFDLHVLGAPPTFALSQDQTLQLAFCDTLIFEAPNLSLSLDSEELTQEPTNLLLSVCYSVFKDRRVSSERQLSLPLRSRDRRRRGEAAYMGRLSDRQRFSVRDFRGTVVFL